MTMIRLPIALPLLFFATLAGCVETDDDDSSSSSIQTFTTNWGADQSTTFAFLNNHFAYLAAETHSGGFDANGDGVTELMVAREEGLEFLSLSHENSGEVLGHLPRGDSRTFTWSLGEDSRGAPALYVLRDPGEVLRWDTDEGEPVLVHRDTQLALPAGVYPFDFVRDLRGLGKRDLALVHRGGVQVAFANALQNCTIAGDVSGVTSAGGLIM